MAGAVTRAIWFTPVEARQGLAQKIFYLHVPSAFIALYIAFGLVAVTLGALSLAARRAARPVAESAAEVGLVFMAVVLLTGPIWGKPIWGTWWTWDARLTLTLFLWFIVVGYLVLRGAVEERGERARYSAVLGHARGAAGAVHPPERVSVPHAAPEADRAQAERAVAAGRC